ncbi:MAG: hypothetical protein QQN45_06665 [Nitrosopumilus sp.]
MEKNDIIRVLEHYDIDYWSAGKNVSENSVNIQCPFCDDHSNHLGIFFPSGFYSCWRCNAKGPFSKVLSDITELPEEQLEEYLEDSGIDFKLAPEDQIREILEERTENKKRSKRDLIALPKHARLITEHIESRRLSIFLESRNISIFTCIKHNCYICDVGDYSGRIIVPVYSNDKLVSFQGIDMTGTKDLHHKTAPGDINEYLYGYDSLPEDNHIMVLEEGIFDKWRTGDEAVACFGTSLTDTQKHLIIEKKPDILVFAWDSDAYWKAKKQAEYFVPFINDIRIIAFPEGHDPDSYGTLRTWKLIDQAEAI